MKFSFMLSTAAVLTALVTPAHAGFFSGNDLLKNCTSSIPQEQSWCLGYVSGATDALQSVRAMMFGHEDLCPQYGTEVSQVKDAVVLYLQNHPAERTLGGDTIVIEAISTNWKCNTLPATK